MACGYQTIPGWASSALIRQNDWFSDLIFSRFRQRLFNYWGCRQCIDTQITDEGIIRSWTKRCAINIYISYQLCTWYIHVPQVNLYDQVLAITSVQYWCPGPLVKHIESVPSLIDIRLSQCLGEVKSELPNRDYQISRTVSPVELGWLVGVLSSKYGMEKALG